MPKHNLSIMGLYMADNTIFDSLVLPESLDADILVNSILLECCDLETVYPNPEFMKYAIELWSKKEGVTWWKLYNTTKLEYDPICNYDRTEEWTETRETTESGESNSNGTLSTEIEETRNLTDTDSGSGTETENSNSTNSEENRVAAYNSTEYQPKDKTSGESTNDGSRETTHENEKKQTGTVETSNSQTDGREDSYSKSGGDNFSRSVRAYGNIGVTTTQEMIEAERKSVQFNIYDFITNSFKNRFCILVY